MPNATKYNSKWEKLPECQGWLSALKLKNNTYSTERAKCSWCNCDFSITHGGLSDVKKHAKTKNHTTFANAKLTTNPVMACFEGNKEILLNAAKEATQVYHMVRHNESFKSMACTSKVIRFVYDQKQFACSATKSMSIVSGVFEPMILNQIQLELDEALYVCLSTDTSSRKETLMYPVIARFFLPFKGIQTRLIDFSNMYSETGKDIFEVLKSTYGNWNIREKISAYCADNCRTNFGNVDRVHGDKNVFTRLQKDLGDKLIGIGCIAHILHNAPEDACLNALPFDVQNVLVLIYKRFYKSTKQTEALKDFCNEMSIEYSKIKGCPKNRFLAKKRSIISLLKVFEAAKKYFLSASTKKVPVSLKNVFSDKMSKFYFIIVRDLCEVFEDAIVKIEGNEITGYEAVRIVDGLYRTLETTISMEFFSLDAEKELENIMKIDENITKKTVFDEILRPIMVNK